VKLLAPSVLHARKGSLGAGSLLRLRDVGRILHYIWTLARFIKEDRFALIHTNSLKADVIGGLAGRLAGIPVLWHVRDRIARDYLPPGVVRVFRMLCRWLPDHVVANSAATLGTLPFRAGNSATTIPSGLKIGRSQGDWSRDAGRNRDFGGPPGQLRELGD